MSKPLKLPPVAFEKLFYLEAELGEVILIGDAGKGNMEITQVTGGFFFGERLRGEVLSFGADWGLEYGGSNILDTISLLKTDDGAYISLSTKGRLTMEPEQYKKMMDGEYIDPSHYFCREHLFFETGDDRYQWLNGIVAFSVAGITEDGNVFYEAYVLK